MPIVLNTKPPVPKSPPVANAEHFIGTYSAVNRWGEDKPSTRVVTATDGNLYWDNPETETPGARLFQLNDSLFTWEAYPYDVFRFHTVDGEVMACSEYYDGMFGMVRMKQDAE